MSLPWWIRLKVMREAAGFSGPELAARIGKTKQYVNAVERNQKNGQNPTLKVLRAWAEACGHTLDVVFPLAGAEPGEPIKDEGRYRLWLRLARVLPVMADPAVDGLSAEVQAYERQIDTRRHPPSTGQARQDG